MNQTCPACKKMTMQQDKRFRLVCQNQGCNYVEFSPITYENDVRNFDGERVVENRFAGNYNSELQNGGLVLEFQGDNANEYNKHLKVDKYSKSVSEARSEITSWCYSLKLSQNIQDLALIRYGQIYKYLHNQEKKEENKNEKAVTQKNIILFAIYCAAFEEDCWYIEEALMKRSGTSMADWDKAKRDLRRILTNPNLFALPKETVWYFCRKYCRDRKIPRLETEAIRKLVDMFSKKELSSGEQNSTAACCIIWILLKRLEKHKDNPNILSDLCEFFVKSEATVKKFHSTHAKDSETEMVDLVLKELGLI